MQSRANNQPLNVDGQNQEPGLFDGCSPFFLNSAGLSFITSWVNRDIALSNAKEDIKFSEQLQKDKEIYEDWKEAEEHALKIWLRDQKRDFNRRITFEKLNNDLAEADLKMFFEDWPLQISVEAILEELNHKSESGKYMRFIIGRFYAGSAKDALSSSYSTIVDNVTTLLQDMGVKDSRVYRFKDCPTVVGGPALANIYAMMSTFPVIVMMPVIDNKLKKIHFDVGCWTPDSPFPFQKRVLSLEYNQQKMNNDKAYFDATLSKVTYVLVTIAGVLNDTYNLSEGTLSCIFPRYSASKALRLKHPEIVDFAVAEYRAFSCPSIKLTTTDGSIINVWEETQGKSQNEIEKIIKESIALIVG